MNKEYQLSTKEIIEKLKTNLKGLSQEEVEKRLKEHGPNELKEKKH